MAATGTHEAHRWLLTGRVQGVGFRPFVFRLAQAHGLAGWVRNRAGEVEIHAQGGHAALARFGAALLANAPPLAQPVLAHQEHAALQSLTGFAILASETSAPMQAHLPPDASLCNDCLRELTDPHDRRYRYPFINCTQCGPRYTLITRLPYDRAHTAMAAFPLCPACHAEYANPADRRFHAEPLACPVCGPQLQYYSEEAGIIDDSAQALAACVMALRAGQIVAVKGVGGYHLLCDAHHDIAIARLRQLKPRPHKPLAVMFPLIGDDGLEQVRSAAIVPHDAAQRLLDVARPIVLLEKRTPFPLSALLAPGLNEVGVFLPYSPLHHLLASDFGTALVATSANFSGEPVLTDNLEAETRLAPVADAFLHHNRPIVRPADDSVYRVLAQRPRPLRLGRGTTPLELDLPCTLARPVLAVGGHMKNTVALAWDRRLVVSPHIGDLGTLRSIEVFEQVIDDLQNLYQVRATAIACDAHPHYASSQYARRSGLPLHPVFHHHAHASALAGEYPEVERWLVFTWDGTGYGEDGMLWGGEALLGAPGTWQRVASFRPFHLPGGEQASRAPWRSALALCWEAGIEWPNNLPDTALLHAAWRKRLNAPQSSAVGRLFDAAAALTGMHTHSSFEGQGPMLLEAACQGEAQAVALPLARNRNGILETDWAPLLPQLLDEQSSVGARAMQFHTSLAQALLEQALLIRAEHGDFCVGLSGGVFQNRVLTEQALSLLKQHGFDARLPERLPCNDAGISAGQIFELQGQSV
jgi:hydrogenase maturation protein HypF